MRRRVPQAVSLCLIAGLIVPGSQGFPVYAAETEAVAEADGETVSEIAADTELTDSSDSETAGETAEASAEEAAETEEGNSVVGELIFAQCEDYINVRTMANTDSPVTAKIYNNDSATVIAVTEDQEWYIVASGNACGYVKAEYFATGEEAQAIASEVAYNVAKVYADELNIRSEASTESDVIDIATAGDEIEVVLYGDDWMKVALGNDVYGYVNSDYVEYITYYPVGETLEEEAARLGTEVAAAETEAQTEAQTQTEAAEEVFAEEEEAVYEETWVETEAVQTEAVQTETVVETEAVQTETVAQTETEAVQTETAAQTETEAVQTETTAQTETEAVQTETTAQTETEAVQTETEAAQTETSAQTEASTEASTTDSSSASTGESIASYALQFVGNPYVYGGTSLTSGADCSGFVQSVFAHFGIYLSRTAAAQSTNGTTVSTSELQAGDLLFYSSSGSGIDHVAIYIGGGRIVHAANSTRGICTDNAFYSTPVCAVRCY